MVDLRRHNNSRGLMANDHAVIIGARDSAVSIQKHARTDVRSQHVTVARKNTQTTVAPRGNITATRTYKYSKPNLITRYGVLSLIVFLIFQPVYVAYGMDLEGEGELVVEEGATTEPAEAPVEEIPEEEVVEEVVAEEPTEEEEEVLEESNEPEATEASEPTEEEEETVEEEEELSEIEFTATELGDEPTPTEDENEEEIGTSTESVITEPTQATSSEETQEVPTEEPEPTSSSGGGGSSDDDEEEVEEETATSTPDGAYASTTDELREELFGTTTATTTNETNNSSGGGGGNDGDDSDTATTTATSTEATPYTGELVQIGDTECMPINDGEFYCFKPDEVQPPTGDIGAARVVARPDKDGDKEIFLIDGERMIQITYNTHDDFAPVYDDGSRRIAWHAMVKDRLQIMLHDRRTGETRQITSENFNSSNPHLYSGKLVWQSWIGDNWEIFMADKLDKVIPRITQLTDNKAHDMFPKVYDDFVTWQAQTRDSWHVVVYDYVNEHFSYVEKNRDGKYENPRFVLLFDNRNENGDVEVVGYDVATDEEVPLAPIPTDTPEPITPTRDTGEAIPNQTGSSTIKVSERRDGIEE